MRISGTGARAESLRHFVCRGRSESGFTLLEILIVLLIVAILASLAVLAVRGRDVQDVVDEEAGLLKALLDLSREDALFRYRVAGVWFYRNGYRFLSYRDDKWESANDRLLIPHQLPEGVEFRLYLEGRPATLEVEEADNVIPQIVFFPDGIVTPFEIAVEAHGAETRTLTGTASGQVELKQIHGPD